MPLQFETFDREKKCSTCDGVIPIRNFVLVWRYGGFFDIFCNRSCWSQEFKKLMKSRGAKQ